MPRSLQHLVVLLGYLLATLLMTYPVARVLASAIPMDHQIEGWYPGDGDPWHYLWAFWYFKRAFTIFPPHPFWTDLVFYPIGFEMPFLTGVGAILLPAALLAPLLGLPLTYNVLWLLSFVLAGYAMYLLGRYLFQDALVAFFCGCLFTFSAYRMIHGREHLPLLMASFLIPVFTLFLFKAAAQPTTRHWVVCALVWALSAGISWYCTIALSLFLTVFALLHVRGRWWRNLATAHLRPAASAVLVLVVTASPFVLPMALSPAAHDGILNRPLTESNRYAADLLAFFVPSPMNPVFGNWTEPVYRHFGGNAYEQTAYLGYVALALSLWGVLRVSGGRTRLFVVTAATFGVLALGPFLHVLGRYRFAVDGEELSVPLPYLVLHYVPLVNGLRVPSRFVELTVFALAVLAGSGLSAIFARVTRRRWRVALVGVLLVGVGIESASMPFTVVSARVPHIYSKIGMTPELFTVLELPLDWRIIKYHYYQAVHGKRLIVGHPVRSREKYSVFPAGLPLIPLLKDPKLLLERGTPDDARRDAERLVAFFDIRYIVIHRRYLEDRVFATLDRFVRDAFAPVARWTDPDVVAYEVRPDREPSVPWPSEYVVDLGANREFALLSGWAAEERASGTTIQWSTGLESSMYVYLQQVEDRVLEMRVHPLTYEGSPPQTVAVSVNGALQDRLTLTPGWGEYRLRIPARAFRVGLNGMTFKYGYAREPAKVIAGNADTRKLAVAFDYVALRRTR